MVNQSLDSINSNLDKRNVSFIKGAIVTLHSTRTRLIVDGKNVKLFFQAVTTENKSVGSENTLLTFDKAYSPLQNVYGNIVSSDGNSHLCYANNNGSVLFTTYKDLPSGTTIFGELSWDIGL